MFQVYMSNKWSWFGRLILNFDVVFIFACEFRRRCVFFCNSTLGLVSAMNFGKCVPLGILMFYFLSRAFHLVSLKVTASWKQRPSWMDFVW